MMRVVFGLLLCLLVSVPAWAVDEITVLGLFSGKAVVRIDGERRVLSRGQRSPEGVKLLEADSESALLEVDGREQRFTLGTQIGSTYIQAKSKVVNLWPDSRGMYPTSGRINGRPVNFLVDTGATLVALNANQASKLGIDFRASKRLLRLQTASGVEQGYQVTLDSVSVGSIELRNVEAAVVEGEHPPMVLLGMSFLKQLKIKRDGPAMTLEKPW